MLSLFKECIVCDELLPITAFGKTANQCHRCVHAIQRERQLSEPRAWMRIKLKNKKNIALQRGIEFELNLDWCMDKWEQGCPYTGKSFELDSNSPYNATFDRIDRSKGYIEGNVQLTSAIYNYSKNKWTHKEVIEFAKTLMKGV